MFDLRFFFVLSYKEKFEFVRLILICSWLVRAGHTRCKEPWPGRVPFAVSSLLTSAIVKASLPASAARAFSNMWLFSRM